MKEERKHNKTKYKKRKKLKVTETQAPETETKETEPEKREEPEAKAEKAESKESKPEAKVTKAEESETKETEAMEAEKRGEPEAKAEKAKSKESKPEAKVTKAEESETEAMEPEKRGAGETELKVMEPEKREEPEAKAEKAEPKESKPEAKVTKAEESEPEEGLEAATMELEAAPYIIPKEAFKLPVWAKVCVIIAAVLVLTYGTGFLFFSGHFMWNSSLNGVDISLLTSKQAQAKLETMADQYELEILERDGETETIAGSDINLDIRFLGDVREIMQQQKAHIWFLEGFRQKNYTVSCEVTYDIERLYEQVQALECMQAENIIEPVEPQIIRTLGVFSVREGEQGRKPLSYAVRKTIRDAVSELSADVDLEQEGCYAVLKYRAEDKEVQEALEILERLQDIRITYQFPDAKDILTGDDILEWVRISEDYEVSIDRKQAEDYIEYLKETYEIRGQIIDFKTSVNQTVPVTSYLRSSELDTDGEVEELLAMLEKARDSRRTEFVRDASDMADIGDTYIEINLTTQHLYCYKDGKMILETDIVSGRPSTGHATPPGIFTIRYTASPAILVGEDYRTPVSYWMPFNGGVGLHDATWQSAFGGSRYISNGSHGCINLPLNMAREIYNNYEAGDVVVVYHMASPTAGTTSPVRPSSSPLPVTTEARETTTQEPVTESQDFPMESQSESASESTEASVEKPPAEPEATTEAATENQNP